MTHSSHKNSLAAVHLYALLQAVADGKPETEWPVSLDLQTYLYDTLVSALRNRFGPKSRVTSSIAEAEQALIDKASERQHPDSPAGALALLRDIAIKRIKDKARRESSQERRRRGRAANHTVSEALDPWLNEALHAAVSSLDNVQAQIVYLNDIQRIPLHEVATILGKSYAVTRRLRDNGLSALRAALSDDEK